MKRVVAGQFRRCHVIVLIRAVAIWLTTVLFSLAVPSAIVAASPVAQSACPSYSYDAPVYDAPDSSATSGRGPPAQRDALIAYSADCWSCGASARSGGATPCAAAKTACFTAGTPVLLADGTSKPIEDIAVGDKVTAYNPDTGKTETRDVVRTFVHHDVPTYDVTLDTGEKVTTTSEHPFWVEGEGWTPATQLRAGDRLRQPDCTSAEVASVRPTGQTGTVYNFEVAGLHDYYVKAGNTWILVHNNCDGLLDESIAIAKHSSERALAGDGTHFVRGVHPDAMAHYVDGVLEGKVPNIEVKHGLLNGRTAYWDPDKGAVIFEDGAGGVSVFTPRDGYSYFEGLE